MNLIRLFLYQHIGGIYQTQIVTIILMAGIALAMLLSYYVCKSLLFLVEKAVGRTPTEWDDDLLNSKFMRAVSQLAPALMLYWLLPQLFYRENNPIHWVKLITNIYIIWAIIYIICIFLGNLYAAMSRRENTRMYAVKGIFQMVKLIIIGMGIIVGLSLVIGKSPVAILTALGASAAVLMLVFRDTILGLVASVQLSVNKMLHRGDWIVAEKHNINGEVTDVSLTTVKVRNWDNSVSTIPPYALISESFRNYEPMRLSGGRRVDRSIYIDLNTVRFLTPEETERLRAKGWLEGIKEGKEGHVVNLRLLRHYLEHWLRRHPDVKKDMLYMVRQMEPTQSGLPLNIYFFLRQTEWKKFEHVQSDIFDHIYAVIHEFGLRIFQTPTGSDIKR